VTSIEIELPDATAKAARDAGLLTPHALERPLSDAIKRREVADALLSIADRGAAVGIPPLSMEEIDAEVKAVHALASGFLRSAPEAPPGERTVQNSRVLHQPVPSMRRAIGHAYTVMKKLAELFDEDTDLAWWRSAPLRAPLIG